MSVLLSLLGFLIFILLIAKFLIHYYLDTQAGYPFKFSVFWGIRYYFLYDKEVPERLIRWKRICNNSYKLLLLLLGSYCVLLIFK